MVLLEVSTVFPFDLFPSRIRVGTQSVAVIDTIFFASHETKTILISDIFNIELMTTPFFSTLELINRQPMAPTTKIKFLRTADALALKNLVQGLMMLSAKNIDLSKYTAEEIKDQITKLGEVAAT